MNSTQANDFYQLNATKANFDEIYSQRDPREYYRVLHGIDYIIPDLAKPIFRDVIASLEARRKRPLTVLDLGGGYGANAALMRYPLDLGRLAQRYRDLSLRDIELSRLMELDRHYFSSWPRETSARLLGLDVSAPAVDYAFSVGLYDFVTVANLETSELDARSNAAITETDLIVSTGCVGYVTERSFARLLAACGGRRPWVASFVLRMFPFDSIAAELEKYDYVTEKLEGMTFVQRRFHSEEEARETLATLERLGIDSRGKEREGLFHAEFHLSRPREDADVPIERVVSVTSGGGRFFGRRYRVVGAENILYLR